VRQHPVLSPYGDKIGGDAHNQKVQQRKKLFKGDTLYLGISLNQLKAHSASAKIIERIMAILALRVQYGNGSRKFFVRKMMVANDNIDAFGSSVSHFLHCLDTAVKGNYQLETVLCGPINTLAGDTVTLVITVRDVEIDALCKAAEE
jgi:hypothetical protein